MRAFLQPKSYKQFCRKTGKWITVTPEPVQYFTGGIKRGGKFKQHDKCLKS